MELSDAVTVAAILLLGFIVAGWLQARRDAHIRRTIELKAAATALEAHYDAVDAIADDPALPLAALEMLSRFTEGISDRRFCNSFTDHVLIPLSVEERERTPAWFDEIEALRKSRPELVANLFKAVGSGLAAAFLRWPGNAEKIAYFTALIAQGDRKEAVMAERVSEIVRKDRNGGTPVGGIPVPA